MGERNDISGMQAFIATKGNWQDLLQDMVAEHLMPALEEFEVDHDAPIFTAAWLFTEIASALAPAVPQFTNSDGDDVLFHDLRFPLASGVTQADVAARLDKVKGLAPEGPKFWNWLVARKSRSGKATGGTMLDSQMDGATVLGSLEPKGKTLLVTVNSAPRAAQVEALITDIARDLLKRPLTTIRT